MKTQRVRIIDGPLPPDVWQRENMEPNLETATCHSEVQAELMRREPLFHRPAFGVARKDFDKLMAPEFWEVSASGRRFSRQFILDVLEERYRYISEAEWEMSDFYCQPLAADTFLASYTLAQGERISRRTTIWRRIKEGWQAVYHQGTLVGAER